MTIADYYYALFLVSITMHGFLCKYLLEPRDTYGKQSIVISNRVGHHAAPSYKGAHPKYQTNHRRFKFSLIKKLI